MGGLEELLGPKPKYYRVHSTVAQKYVEQMMNSSRFWTSYPADVVEKALWEAQIIPVGAHYMTFLTVPEELLFREMVFEDAFIDYTGDVPKAITKEEFDSVGKLPATPKALPPSEQVLGDDTTLPDTVLGD